MPDAAVKHRPDYRFSLDRKLFGTISAIPGVNHAVKAFFFEREPRSQREGEMYRVAVGPDQRADIYAASVYCAQRLDIGTPRIFLEQTSELSAETEATDDREPSITLTTGLVERLSPEELKAVIGHECGHIHCLHGAYSSLAASSLNFTNSKILPTAIGLMAVTLLRRLPLHWRFAGEVAFEQLYRAVGHATWLILAKWSRCAEITCDRAGAICAGDPTVIASALAKLASGGIKDFNVDAYARQADTLRETVVSWFDFSDPRRQELEGTHPLLHKRIQTVRVFAGSDVFRAWCPDFPRDLRIYGPVRPLSEIDHECETLIAVLGRAKRRQNPRRPRASKLRIPYFSN